MLSLNALESYGHWSLSGQHSDYSCGPGKETSFQPSHFVWKKKITMPSLPDCEDLNYKCQPPVQCRARLPVGLQRSIAITEEGWIVWNLEHYISSSTGMDNLLNMSHCLNKEKRQQEHEQPSISRYSEAVFCMPSPALETTETQKKNPAKCWM